MAVKITVNWMINGYHVYRDTWNAFVDEQLVCKQRPFISADPFSVTVVKGDTTVGHVPRKIFSICSLFL